MKALKYLSVVLGGLFIFIACQKEYSVESGFAGKVATGTLVHDSVGNCNNIAVTGSYIIDSTLTDSNYVTVQVNFATGGSYRIFTDTQNGFSFQDSGFSAAGIQNIRLRATGKPISAQPTTFQVAFDTSFCSFTVTVVANTPASYSLVSSTSGVCGNVTLNGGYTTGTALTANNTVTLEVAVTTPGSYSITTGPIGGMTFTGVGNLTTVGLQVVTLYGTGTPTTAGDNVFPVTAGSSSCSFTIPVTDGGTGNTDPNASDSAWSFAQGTNSFNGPFYDVFDTTVNNLYGLLFIGSTAATGDTTFAMGIGFPGNTIAPGTYSSKTGSVFHFTEYRGPTDSVPIYTADINTQTVNTQITISTYDPTTKLVTGTFTGTAMNTSGTSVPITNGKFKAIVR